MSFIIYIAFQAPSQSHRRPRPGPRRWRVPLTRMLVSTTRSPHPKRDGIARAAAFLSNDLRLKNRVTIRVRPGF